MRKKMAIDVFIAYARKDRELRCELDKHLSSLRRLGIINHWFDGDIIEGTEWKKQVLEHLHNAQIILLLISPDFIASNFCYNIEMKKALERHDANEARVIPILLRPVDWLDLPLARIQAAPEDGKPVTQWPDVDAALLDVIKRIKRSIKHLQKGNISTEEQGKNSRNNDPQKPPAEWLELPSAASRTINSIEQVSGGSIVLQGNHVNSSIRYDSSYEKGSEKLLTVIKDLVDKTNELCDEQISPQEGSPGEEFSQIDPGYLKWFMDVMWDLKQQAIPIPTPLLVRIQKVCHRLHIPCFLT
jgi:hypothetical protein